MTGSSETPRALPDRPDLRHLKDQAKDLLRSGEARSLADALFRIARRYGFASWPALKFHIETLQAQRSAATSDVVDLKRAIDAEDLSTVIALMSARPELHRAPMGYRENGPLTWVAECRVPWGSPSATRLAIAAWMLDHGSDVHQGGDGPLMRAALHGDRIAMMQLLVSRGADVNAVWNGTFPIVFAPCETLDPVALAWLLDHGANPNCADPTREFAGTALDYVLGTYVRSPQLSACIDLLLAAGATTMYNVPAVLSLLRGQMDQFREAITADPSLITQRFPTLDFGASGGRMLTLRGATLLHVAAEFRNDDAIRMLIDRGADVNARALTDEAGVGGQTAIFHAVTQFDDAGATTARLLLDAGADLSIRAKVPGHYEQPGAIVECTPLGYLLAVADESARPNTAGLLRARGAPL